ncbi:MAG: hypothetical protein RBT76_13505 [candidate division Zixibacteria bacterium]|nr:hypothetical protein [candidate division Zixibacteria bacterium]
MKAENLLKGHERFRSLHVKDADQLSNASSTKECHSGETIFKCGAPSSHVYMLMSRDVHLMLPAEKSSPGIVLAKVARIYFERYLELVKDLQG